MSNYVVGASTGTGSLNGLILLNDKNLADFEASDVFQPSQFIDSLYWQGASNGTQHKWLVEDGAPGVGWRTVNNGVTNAAGTSKLVTANLLYLDATVRRDVMLRKGDDVGNYLERESIKSLSAAFGEIERQFVLGTAHDAAGPDGLADLTITVQADAGGAASTYKVYMMTVDEDAVSGVLGNDGQVSVGDPYVASLADAGGALYNADVVPIEFYSCLQVAGSKVVGEVINLDGTAGHTLTDDLLSELYLSFPASVQERINLIVMGSTSMLELVTSRTATSPTGAPAPMVTTWDFAGRPIKVAVTGALS